MCSRYYLAWVGLLANIMVDIVLTFAFKCTDRDWRPVHGCPTHIDLAKLRKDS
jgi:hypothetical protein